MATSPSKRQSMSTIESSVTRLLVATKHLLESLTQWSKRSATEADISDAYVQLGNEFKVACRAFSNAGVDVSDLGDVPHALRVVLEEALCEEPSQESLDKFLPNIREIIVTLLQNLKTKQAVARTIKVNKSRESLKSIKPDTPVKRTSSSTVNGHERTSSVTSRSTEMRQRIASDKQDQPLPTPPVVNSDDTPTTPSFDDQEPAVLPKKNLQVPNNDALAQLQKGDSLQRRASRRFSAYQYAKLTSYSPGRDPELPDQSIIERSKTLGRSPLQNKTTVISADGGSEKIDVFLKIGDKVKKCSLVLPITFTSLRLLFVEKFTYSPGSGTFPEIYIQDNDSHISYELEEHHFEDIKTGSVISLNINKNAEIFENLNKNIQELRVQLHIKQAEFFENTKNQIEESHNGLLDKLHTILESPSINGQPQRKDTPVKSKEQKSKLIGEISDLREIRHELGVIKQISNTNKSQFKDSINHILQKVRDFKSLSLDSSKSSNRTYMEESHSKLSKDSDVLLTKFDDLQDLIEALRKDVAQRGARPSEKQLDHVEKELITAQKDLENMVSYITTEKPNWKKIWEAELDTVCQEQQFLTLQEDLAHDLKEDLEKASETFDLVKQCCVEQSKNPRFRPTNLPLAEPGSLPDLRYALMSEVEALNPNHENRVEAIERAEKLREKERELTMMNGFEEELDGFVTENKLKKSGGIEEVERMRKQKDEDNLRSAFPPLY